MSREEIRAKVTEIFHSVFDDESIEITDSTTADDIEAWDSLTHITLINEVEIAFDYRFSMKEVLDMANVGEMLNILHKYTKG